MKFKLSKIGCLEKGTKKDCLFIIHDDPPIEIKSCLLFKKQLGQISLQSLRLAQCKEKFPDGIKLSNLGN